MSQPRAITRIVIHCSASLNGRPVTAAVIDGWHKARSFRRGPSAIKQFNPALKHIGYHWVIEVGGETVTGRAPTEIGAHAAGANADSLAVCMVGTNSFSLLQWFALERLVESIRAERPSIAIVGHRDLSPDLNRDGRVTSNEWVKTCPGFDVAAWMQGGLRPMAGHILTDAH